MHLNVRKINNFLKEWFERLEIIKYLLPKYVKISSNINGMNYKLLYGLPLMPSIFQIKKWWSKNAWHKKFNDNTIYFIHIAHSVLLTYQLAAYLSIMYLVFKEQGSKEFVLHYIFCWHFGLVVLVYANAMEFLHNLLGNRHPAQIICTQLEPCFFAWRNVMSGGWLVPEKWIVGCLPKDWRVGMNYNTRLGYTYTNLYL